MEREPRDDLRALREQPNVRVAEADSPLPSLLADADVPRDVQFVGRARSDRPLQKPTLFLDPSVAGRYADETRRGLAEYVPPEELATRIASMITRARPE